MEDLPRPRLAAVRPGLHPAQSVTGRRRAGLGARTSGADLGLDLQGGSYLLLEVDTGALRKRRLTNLTEDVRTRLQGAQIGGGRFGVSARATKMRMADPTKADAAFKLLNSELGERLLTGGRDVVVQTRPDQHIQVSFVSQAANAAARDAVSRSIEIIRKRIDALGTKEPGITQQGSNRIVVEAPRKPTLRS